MKNVMRVTVAIFTLAGVGRAQAAPVENGAHPVVAPDGRHIAFVSSRDGTSDLYVMSPAGEQVTRLTNSTASEGIAGWSADGAQLYYSNMSHDTATLNSVSVTGGKATTLGIAVGQGVRLFPDGKRVIVGEVPWQSMQVFMMNLDGTNRQRLTDGTGAHYCSAIAPDSSHIATSRSAQGPLQVWLFSTVGGASRQLTHSTDADGSAQCPVWSADGRRIAYQSDVPNRANPKLDASHIWMVDVVNGEAKKLAPHEQPYLDELPSWFPDGKRIAFQSNRTGRWEVFSMKADGTDVRQLTR